MKEIIDNYAQSLGYKNYIELLNDSSDLEIEFHTINVMRILSKDEIKNKILKTDVSIKFNNIREYRVIEKKLEDLGYSNDRHWNDTMISSLIKHNDIYNFWAHIVNGKFTICNHNLNRKKDYNSLNEFLND